MKKTTCDKCRSPIFEEDGKIVCAICGADYTPAPVHSLQSDEDYSEFYDRLSLEEFRAITARLENTVTDNFALSSDGKTFAFDSYYDFPFFGAVQFSDTVYKVAITKDGDLQTKSFEIEELLQRIRNSGSCNLQMKQILKIGYKDSRLYGADFEDNLFGLDIKGKIVLYNPMAVFFSKQESYSGRWYYSDMDKKRCVEIGKRIQKLPALRRIFFINCMYFAVTESGDVHGIHGGSAYSEKIQKVLEKWKNIESLHYFDGYYIGLKKDGTFVAYIVGKKEPEKEIIKTHNIYGSNIVQIKKINYGLVAFLYQNGDLVLHSDKTVKAVAKNVVSIVDIGYIGLDGSLWKWEDPIFEKISDVKLFDNIETLHEEWESMSSACYTKKQEIETAYKTCSEELAQLKAEREKLQEQKQQLGFFQFAEKREIRENLEALEYCIEQEAYKLHDLAINLSAVCPKPKKEDETIGYTGTYSTPRRMDPLQKEKSVVGSAVVGGLIAGPAGAVVGAIYAADKNSKNKK